MERIVCGFQKLNLLPDSNVAYSLGASESYYRALLSYEPVARLFSMPAAEPWQNVIAMNAQKYALAAQSFGRVWSPRALCCASAYTLAGCIIDHMIDEGTLEERKRALSVLHKAGRADSTYFSTYSTCFVEELLGEVYTFFESIKCKDKPAYRTLRAGLQRAAYAEAVASVRNDNTICARDKSEFFVLYGFLIAASGRLSSEEQRLCGLIGKAMRLVDDLCDLEDDQKHGRANSLICQRGEATYVIEQAFCDLENTLKELQKRLSDPFYEFILCELKEWTRVLPDSNCIE